MQAWEATELIRRTLQAGYPERDFAAPMTAAIYVEQLVAYELSDAEPAIHGLLASWGSFPPSPGEVNQACWERRRDRAVLEAQVARQEMLEVRNGFVAFAPEEVAEILGGYFARIGQGPGQDAAQSARARLQWARKRGSSAEQLAAARALALAQVEGAVAKAKPPIPRARDPRLSYTPCGVKVGTEAVQEQGVWVCPNCRSPIVEGCRRPAEMTS